MKVNGIHAARVHEIQSISPRDAIVFPEKACMKNIMPTPGDIQGIRQLNSTQLFRLLEYWSRWEAALGTQALVLRQAFSEQSEGLKDFLLLFFEARQARPKTQWIQQWERIRASLLREAMCNLLLALATPATVPWYGWQVNLCCDAFAGNNGRIRYERFWDIYGDTLYERFFDEDGRRINRRSWNEHGVVIDERFRDGYTGTDRIWDEYTREWYKLWWNNQGTAWHEYLIDEFAAAARKIARGAYWALADFPETRVRDFLTQHILDWSRSGESNPSSANAAILALTRFNDEDALRRLNTLYACVTHRSLRKRLQDTLETLAMERGMSRDDMADQLVADHDLSPGSTRTWEAGDYRVSLSIASDGKLERTVVGSNGKPHQSLPRQVRETYANLWQEILTEGKTIRATITTQKNRLEAAMVDRRRWKFAMWKRIFTTHPILGQLARRLIWEIFDTIDRRTAYALPGVDGTWRNAHNEAVEVSIDSTLTIAHFIEMPTEEHSAWQRFIITQRIIQPFKQAFREMYILTPAEEQTGDYSNRFAAHIVSLPHLQALAYARGWSGPLGFSGFDGAGEGWRDFHTTNVRATLLQESIIREDYNRGYGTIQQISFYPVPQRGEWIYDIQLIPLRDVDPIVFSETMRDVDLFVAVASVGTNVDWQDPIVAFRAAREKYEETFAASADMRAVLLQELLPALDPGDRVQLQGRNVDVRGYLGNYRLHLGSGSIHIQPSGQYLCIVPKQVKQPDLYLPFEDEDVKTMEIISKILLLVHDDQITDVSILRQLNRHATISQYAAMG